MVIHRDKAARNPKSGAVIVLATVVGLTLAALITGMILSARSTVQFRWSETSAFGAVGYARNPLESTLTEPEFDATTSSVVGDQGFESKPTFENTRVPMISQAQSWRPGEWIPVRLNGISAEKVDVWSVKARDESGNTVQLKVVATDSPGFKP